MSLVRWDDKFLIGNEMIDQDHKNLFEMVNEFYDELQEKNRRSDLTRILAKLVRYAEVHFQREEGIMQKCGYPLLGEHQLSHASLYEQIYELNERVASDPRPLDRVTITFVKDWLVDHVTNEDAKIREFLIAQKPRT